MCHCVVGVASAMWGSEGGGGHGSAGLTLPGQEGSSLRLKSGSHNQHVVGGGVWQQLGVGGVTDAATVDVVGRRQGGGCGGSDVVLVAATRGRWMAG